MPRFEQIRSCCGNPRLKPLYKEIVDAVLERNSPLHWFTASGRPRGHGLSNGEIIEVAMIAAFANFLNAWAEVSTFTDREETSA